MEYTDRETFIDLITASVIMIGVLFILVIQVAGLWIDHETLQTETMIYEQRAVYNDRVPQQLDVWPLKFSYSVSYADIPYEVSRPTYAERGERWNMEAEKPVKNSRGGNMRKVEVQMYELKITGTLETGLQQGREWVKHEGLFHEWAIEDAGDGPTTMGLVELEDGRIVLALPERVRFLDR